ncbi:hypothetical protein [Streptomyces sp. NPDC088801]|uniref:hypothetical protein n=1 Tax=Streptomyces sp. NPDC088801 TaxID=3365903 RepID=UPI003804C830
MIKIKRHSMLDALIMAVNVTAALLFMKYVLGYSPTDRFGPGDQEFWVTSAMSVGTALLFFTMRKRAAAWAEASNAGAGVTRLAAWVAGGRRDLCPVWLADLAGDPEAGITLSAGDRRRLAAGFVVAAARMRLHDMFGWAWTPLDWLLSKDSRTNGFIATVVGAQAIYIVDDGGIPALVTEIWEPCGILGAGLYVLARWLRRVRGIELATASPPPEE